MTTGELGLSAPFDRANVRSASEVPVTAIADLK